MKDDGKSASRFGAKPTDGLCAVLPKSNKAVSDRPKNLRYIIT